VRLIRTSALGAVALTGAIGLSACGSDNNTTNQPGSGSTGNAGGSGSTGSAGGSAAANCPSGTLKAEGSSAQKNAIEVAIKSFQNKCADVTVNYNASGSGAGIKQFLAGQVDFAGSDSALKPDEAKTAEQVCGSPAWNVPMVTGPLGVAYNLPGVDKLVLNGEVTAKIFTGVVKKWNDPAITALNSGATLPDKDITVFFRSDESGTTDNFTNYLKAAGKGAWTVEAGKKWNGPVGEGKPQNAGVASATKTQEGSISYLEWSYITQNKLGMAQIDTGSGPVALTPETVGKSVSTAKQVGTGNDLSLKLDYATKEPGAYPIILVTYEIVCSKYKDQAKASSVKAFLTHMASSDVQKAMQEVGYAPLPTDIAGKVSTAISAIG
jgi:phosphate transport system substrate-binding protein